MAVNPRNARFVGLVVEFDTPDAVIAAAKAASDEGYQKYDAFSPYPIEELNHIVAGHDSKLPFMVFMGGLMGFLGGFALQYWVSVIAYPMTIGGRPLNSWPAFIIPTFEMTILFAGFTAVLGMFALNGLPRPHHPLFNVERFALATDDRFFLWIEKKDPKFEEARTRAFLESLNPVHLEEVYDD